jgi:hypothetical protein
MANQKALCSHRSVDNPIVMEVFRKLREANIDAWVSVLTVAVADFKPTGRSYQHFLQKIGRT